MFSKKENKTVKNKVMEINVVGKNTTIVGDINSDGDFRIDGTLEGTLTTNGTVIIGTSSIIKGTVNATNADIEGKFTGELLVSNTLTVKATSVITGNVTIGNLSVEPGASFNATCTSKGAIKELNSKNDKEKRSEKTA